MKHRIPALLAVTFVLGFATDRVLLWLFNNGDKSQNVPGVRSEQGAVSLLTIDEDRDSRVGSSRENPEPTEPTSVPGRFTGTVSDLLVLVKTSSWEPDADAVERLLQSADASRVERLVASLGTLDQKDPRTRFVVREVFRRFAEVDPGKAIVEVMKQNESDLKHHVIDRAFETLAKKEFAEAVAAFSKLTAERFFHGAVHGIMRGMDPEDSPKLADFIRTLPEPREYSEFISLWANRDPGAAMAYALGIRSRELRGEWLRSAAHGWARQDAEGALAWLNKATAEADEQRAAEGIMHAMIEHDPEGASKVLAKVSADSARHFVRDIARQWSQRDLKSALQWVKDLPPNQQRHATRGLLHTWSRTDPTAAADYLETLPPSEEVSDAMHDLAREWAEKDLKAAGEWAMRQSDGEGRARAIDGVTNRWARQDPAGAARFVESLNEPHERREALETVGNSWSRQDMWEAVRWAKTLDPMERVYAAEGILGRAADQDPDIAVEFFSDLTSGMSSEEMEAGEFHELAGDLAGHISEFDPRNAANWAESLPEGSKLQREAVERVADRWVQNDSMAASEWISQLPEGRVRDAATEQLVDNISRSDPAAAFEWALSASEEEHRHDMIHEVLERWNRIDPVAARATLESAPVSEEQRHDLGEIFHE